jgi:cell division protein FtsB
MIREKSHEKSNKWLWRLVFFLTLITMFLGGLAISKEAYKKRQIQKEIDQLKNEAERIKKENLDLDEKIQYLGSQDYQKKEAKDKLNLQSPGENLVVIKPSIGKKEAVAAEFENLPAREEEKNTNQKKWWDYFFKY